MNYNLKRVYGTTYKELGDKLLSELNKGWSLSAFGNDENGFFAEVINDKIPLADMNDEDFDNHFEVDNKKNALKKAGLL